jgi:hypothetical protein
MSIAEFGNTAKKLTHNPLGIIALFIVLVYAFASLVVGFGANLEQTQKTPLIWFLVLFPVLVLLVFAWLVSRHHMKLYAPTDYRDEKLFVYPISPEDQRSRLQDEAAAIQLSEPEPPEPPILTTVESIQPTTTTTRVPPNTRNAAVSRYLIAEDLAVRQLEAELGVPIAKQVEIMFADTRIMLDGLITKGDEYIGIEVKYARTSHLSLSVIQATLFRFLELSNKVQSASKGDRFRFIIILVTEFAGEELERFKARMRERFAATVVPLEWRFYNFAELKNKFGVVEEQA